MKGRKINYLILTLAVAVFWAGINLWYILVEIYSLNNSSIADTSTAIQSLKSIFLFKPFLNTDPGGSYLAVHASEFLFALLPGFSLEQGFVSLYITQLAITYAASVPLYLMARKILKDDRSAFLISMVYVFFPYINNNPFELLSLFMGLIIFSLFFLETKHYAAFTITFLLSLSTMEFAPLIGVYVGLYLILVYIIRIYRSTDKKTSEGRFKAFIKNAMKQIRFSKISQAGIFIAVISVLFYIIDSGIISFFSHGTHPITSNLAGAGINILPTIPSKIQSFMELNAPLAMMSFLDPVWLLELPWILASGITSFGPYWSPNIYYSSYVVPFVVISAIYGIGRFSTIVKDKTARKKLIRIMSSLVLLISLLLLVSTSVIPMVQGASSFNIEKGYNVLDLSSLIPSNQSVYTGMNEMPIVSSNAWNTWICGGDRNYTLFNAMNGSPFNLSSYNLVASTGSYVLMSKTYNKAPDFNDYHLNRTLPPSSPLQPYSQTSSFFLPKGNYSANIGINYSSQPIYKSTINSGNISYNFMPERYVIIQPFTVSAPVNLSTITVPATLQSGYYIIQSMITRNLNVSSIVTQESEGRNQYNTPFLQLSYPHELLSPNVTYYFWLWSSGNPGGLYLPMTNTTTYGGSETALIYNGSGTDSYGYYFSSYSNLTDTHKGLFFTLAGGTNSPESAITYKTKFTISVDGKQLNESLIKSAKLSFNISQSRNEEVNFQISSSYLNGTINNMSYKIKSDTYSGKNNEGISNSPYVFLVPIFFVFIAIAACSLLNINFKFSSMLRKVLKLMLLTSTIIFYGLLAIFYYFRLPIIVYLQASAIILLISLFFLMLFGGYFGYDDKSEESFMSPYGGTD